MSDTDSFIDEVSEEVRRDALYGYLRRYGWIAVAIVLLLVGGAAWSEYKKSQARQTAEAAGDALMGALAQNTPEARAQALAGIELQGPASVIGQMIEAATLEESGDFAAARTILDAVSTSSDAPDMYRELAAFKAALLPNDDADARAQALEALAAPGAPFALLAQEQLALMQIDAGQSQDAIASLTAIAEDAGASRGLRERVQSLIVALGGEISLPNDSE